MVKRIGLLKTAARITKDMHDYFAAGKSAVVDHALRVGHSINWKRAKVLDTAAGMDKRRIKEKLPIERLSQQEPLMNKDRGLKADQIWLNKRRLLIMCNEHGFTCFVTLGSPAMLTVCGLVLSLLHTHALHPCMQLFSFVVASINLVNPCHFGLS